MTAIFQSLGLIPPKAHHVEGLIVPLLIALSFLLLSKAINEQNKKDGGK